MAYHPRIETDKYASFLTTRSRNEELWFINNKELEESIMGYTAKFSTRYNVNLYAIAIEGNHIHGIATFPEKNRYKFMRDWNSCIARAVPRLTTEHPGGRFWARRYSQEFVPTPNDIEEYFFYTVLQPVKDGLVKHINDYPGYNCFHDAVNGITRTYTVVNWTGYNNAKRFNPDISIKDYIEEVHLSYTRLPGYEHLTQSEYASIMHKKLEERTAALVEKRTSEGKGFVGAKKLRIKKRGSRTLKSKKSGFNTKRPRVLSGSDETKAEVKGWYFSIYNSYKETSKKYRGGDLLIIFPHGTFPPMRAVVV